MTAKRLQLRLLTLGLFTIAAALVPATHSVAKDISATTLELSAQSDQPGQKKVVPLKKQGNVPRQNIQKPRVIIQQNQPRIIRKPVQVQKQQNFQVQKKVIVVPQSSGRKKFVGQPRVFKPKHQNVVSGFRLRNANQALLHGQTYSVHRRDYRRRYNGRFYTFVAIGLLAPLAIGAATYYPYAYLSVPENYCEGLTDDGCEMVYDEVETADGEAIPQCVAYCPWQ